MEIPINYIIHDIRINNDFKGITISGFKRKDVINVFQNCMINNKIEDAIRWCVELHCTGLNNIIWNCYDNIYLKYIHINNPKLFFYLLKRKKEYNNIIKRYPKKHEIFSRNNQEIRNLFAEITSILTLTKKNNIFLPKSLPKIKDISFDKYEIKKRMISKNSDSILYYIDNTTTNDEKLALNEIMNNLLYKNGTFENCLYWYLWLEKYKTKNKDKDENKIKMLFENINFNKDEQYYSHWTFILWRILMSFEHKLDKNDIIFIKKIEYIYKVDFKINSINKKKFYFFIVFYIIKNNINWNISLFQNEYLIIQTNANINMMYYNIIKSIESKLSENDKILLKKQYNQIFFTLINTEKPLKKVKDNSLDIDINKVVFTEYPEYYDIKNNNNFEIPIESIQSHNIMQQNHNMNSMYNMKNNNMKLINKNKTKRDVIKEKEEAKNKQLEALSQFITYKKEPNNIKKSTSVLDYYNNNEENSIKIITQNKNNNDSYNIISDKNKVFEIIKT
jgi:hypothetical protein